MRVVCLGILVAGSAICQTAVELQRASAALQRESARRQAEALGTMARVVLTPGPAPNAPCDPIADEVSAPVIESAAKAQQLDANLLRAVIHRESGFRPCAVSPKGAQGLMQLMPATADDLGVTDPFDIAQNIGGGARYLKQLLDKYKGDVGQALAAYNAGPATVDRAGGTPNIAETQNYVKAILDKLVVMKTSTGIAWPKPIEP